MNLKKLTYNQLIKLSRVERNKYIDLPDEHHPDRNQLLINIRAIDDELKERAKQVSIDAGDAWVKSQQRRKLYAWFWIAVGILALLVWLQS